MNEEISKLAYYRLDRADESIREAELLLKRKLQREKGLPLWFPCLGKTLFGPVDTVRQFKLEIEITSMQAPLLL